MDVSREDYVPKKFITSYLVNFFNIEASEKTKNEMLLTLSKLLNFSQEEKERVGLD